MRHLDTHIGDRCTVRTMPDQALLALQGPAAVAVLAPLAPASKELTFMSGRSVVLAGAECYVTRSGYTGEDGFEISVPAEAAEALARLLLRHPQVEPAGLGARDTLRLEAGLCLYGHDIDATTTPIEAGLSWAIQKVRRPAARGKAAIRAPVIDAQLARARPTSASAWSASSACRCARARRSSMRSVTVSAAYERDARAHRRQADRHGLLATNQPRRQRGPCRRARQAAADARRANAVRRPPLRPHAGLSRVLPGTPPS